MINQIAKTIAMAAVSLGLICIYSPTSDTVERTSTPRVGLQAGFLSRPAKALFNLGMLSCMVNSGNAQSLASACLDAGVCQISETTDFVDNFNAKSVSLFKKPDSRLLAEDDAQDLYFSDLNYDLREGITCSKLSQRPVVQKVAFREDPEIFDFQVMCRSWNSHLQSPSLDRWLDKEIGRVCRKAFAEILYHTNNIKKGLCTQVNDSILCSTQCTILHLALRKEGVLNRAIYGQIIYSDSSFIGLLSDCVQAKDILERESAEDSVKLELT